MTEQPMTLWENIVQSGREPICAFDLDFRLIGFNQAHSDEFYRIYAYRVKLGDVFPDLFLPEQAPIMRGFMTRALQGEQFSVVEEFGDPHLNRPYWEINYSPLRDAQGKIIGAFHQAQDISARLRAEALLARAEETLRQSQKMEAVGQLTGGLAHDFNNLLVGIMGSLELLQVRVAQGRTNELGRYIDTAHSAAKRAAALTHRLLAFSRRQTLEPKPTDVNRLIAGMEDLIRRTVGPQIVIKSVVEPQLWTTRADQSQLENSLLNLCINARDAMPGGGTLTIETANLYLDNRAAAECDLPAGEYISLAVSDDGIGMSPEVKARAFDPFFTTKPIGMGTGLGLSMIYGFVRQSNGHVHITSEPGRGSVLRLYFPRHMGEVESPAAPAELTVSPHAAEEKTVLVVDDEPSVRMLVTEAIEDLGYTAIEATDGMAGLRILESDTPIDLLISDVGLPGGLNGRQVADAGRAVRPDLKVLFITGYAENAVLNDGQLAPGMHVLTKPFAMDALTNRIKALTRAN